LVSSILLLPVVVSRAESQAPGKGVTVAIDIKSVTVVGDTVAVTERVTNSASSRDSLLTYMIDSPSGITAIQRPTTGGIWVAQRAYRGRPMAYWIIGSTIVPGGTSPDLYFVSVGVPGIVTYWAQGEHEPAEVRDVPDSTVTYDPMNDEMVNGSTVGVSPWPVDRSAAGLLSRLRGLTQTSCASPLSWVNDSSLCTQLLVTLDQAESYRANGQTTEARASLDAYTASLSGPNGTFAPGVSSSGYWLLVANANIVKSLL